MFKGFSKRRSEHKESPLDAPRRVSAGKSDIAITAPKRIVRALYSYEAHDTDELSFRKNDFFYVTDETDPEWYVASNPLTNQSGLVPVSYFEVIQRQDPAQPLSLTQAQSQQRAHSRSASAATNTSTGTTGTSNTSGTQGSGTYGGGAAGGTAPNLTHHRAANSQSSGRSQRSSSGTSKHLYGFVLFDFTAERNDELSISAGESIVITAISNAEWFVAKPIGRLGGPGLIPVSYVEVREVGTDRPVENVLETVRRAGVPYVEEWKRRLAEYKASSIPLGRFGTTAGQLDGKAHHQSQHSRSGSATYQAQPTHQPAAHQSVQQHAQIPHAAARSAYGQPQGGVAATTTTAAAAAAAGAGGAGGGVAAYGQPNQHQHHHQPAHSGYHHQQSTDYGPNGYAENGYANGHHHHHDYAATNINSTLASQSHENLPYVDNSQSPYVVSASVDRFAINGGRYWYLVRVEMSNGRHRNLCRYYQDFYDFQIRLLEEFPVEAGRTGKPRSLPFMPGPLTLVTHTVSTQRRANLDDYVRELIRMPPSVSRSRVMLNLFELRPGDVEGNGPMQQLPQPPEGGGDEGELETVTQDGPEEVPAHVQAISPTASPPRSPPRSPRDDSVQTTPNAVTSGTAAFGSRSSTSAPRDTQSSPSTLQAVSPHAARPYGERSGSVSHGGDSHQSLKIKVYATDNVIAIRVPADLSFNEIYERIATRMAVSNPRLYASKDLIGEPVQSASAFARVVNGGNKVALYLGP